MKITITCKQCGKQIQKNVYPSYQSKCTLEFCSPACRNKSRSLKDIPCPICGTLFKPRNGGVGKPRKKYCSRRCFQISKIGSHPKIRTRIPEHTKQRIIDLYKNHTAKEISEIMKRTISSIRNVLTVNKVILPNKVGYQRRANAARKRMLDPNINPGYISGNTCRKWGNDWIPQRKMALVRDSYTCQSCGKYARTVHHIKPRREFDVISESNDLNNLITLCNHCHLLIERKKKQCPIPKQ